MLNIALALIPAGDNDGQAMLFADTVAGAADLMVAALVGMVVLVVGEADRIENQVIMDVILVNVSGVPRFVPLSMAWRRVQANSMSAVSAEQPKEDTSSFPSVLSGLQI